MSGELPTERYDFELERVFDEIKRRMASIVGVQLPEGLKQYGAALSEIIEAETGADVLLSARPCWGACDLDLELFELGADILINFGHASLPLKMEKPVIYVELHSKQDVLPVVKKAIPKLPEGKIGLVTTSQHIHGIEEAAKVLKEAGIDTIIGDGSGRAVHPGLVLGCNVSSARSVLEDVSGYLFIGSGEFHPLGVALGTGKPVIAADPFTGEVKSMDKAREKILRQRHAIITKAQDATSFCIILTDRVGQRRSFSQMKKALRDAGKSVSTVVCENLSEYVLDSFPADAYVAAMCPRVAIDEAARFKKPVLTPNEVEIVLGLKEWEDYALDEL